MRDLKSIFLIISIVMPVIVVAQPAESQIDSLIDVVAQGRESNLPIAAQFENLAALVEHMAMARDRRADGYIKELATMAQLSNTPLAYGLYHRAVARVYDRSGANQEALEHYMMAIDSLNGDGSAQSELAMTYVHTAFLLNNSGTPDKCLELLDKAKPLAERSGNHRALFLILDYYGDYHYYSAFGIEDWDKALEYYQAAQTLIETHQLERFRSNNAIGLANVYYRLKQEQEGDHFWNVAKTSAAARRDYNSLYAIHVDKAEIFRDQGRYQEAVALAEEAAEFAESTGWPELRARAQRQLSASYRLSGDFENALYSYDRYRSIEDSMQKQDLLLRYQQLEATLENERKEQLISDLNNKNLRQGRNFLAGIALLLALLGTLMLWTNLRLRRSNVELAEKNRQIQQAHVEGQTLERRRLASELHDNLNTKIAALRWQLQAVESDEPRNMKILERAVALTDDVYADVRLIAHNLMPEEIEKTGLVQALNKLLENINTNQRVTFSLLTEASAFSFPPSLIYPIYNIIYELINNIIKHADADRAWISISKDEQILTVTVSDDGKGFDISQDSTGVGLRNIRSRIDNLGGTLEMRSEASAGTVTTVRIPLV